MDVNHKEALILLVDDEEDIISIYKTKLEKAGFEIITATEGVQALQLAIKRHPDLILMDMKMPIMDGITAQLKLKENPATKDVRVVFLTAFSDPAHPEAYGQETREIGAIDFIRKGIGLDELVTKVRGYLEK